MQGFFACNESTAVGALQALQSQKRGEIKLVGFDSAPALLQALRGGQIDALVRCRHGLEFVHVGADGIHQDLARENGVLGNRGALVLARRHRTHADSEQCDGADHDAHPPPWPHEQVRNTYHSAPP